MKYFLFLFIRYLLSRIDIVLHKGYIIQDDVEISQSNILFNELVAVDFKGNKSNPDKKVFMLKKQKISDQETLKYSLIYLLLPTSPHVDWAQKGFKFEYRLRAKTKIFKRFEFVNIPEDNNMVYSYSRCPDIISLKNELRFYLLKLAENYKCYIIEDTDLTHDKEDFSMFFYINKAVRDFIIDISYNNFNIDEMVEEIYTKFAAVYFILNGITSKREILERIESRMSESEIIRFILSKLDKFEKKIMTKLKCFVSMREKNRILLPSSIQFKSDKFYIKTIFIELKTIKRLAKPFKIYFFNSNNERVYKNYGGKRFSKKDLIIFVSDLLEHQVSHIIVSIQGYGNKTIKIKDLL